VTDKERLHLVEQMGEFMAEVDPENQKDQQRSSVTINVNSPNCVVAGDRIEINIHVGNEKSGHAAEEEDASPRSKASSAEIRRLVTNTVEALFQGRSEWRASSSRLTPAKVRVQ
jgi:hypothetical protein